MRNFLEIIQQQEEEKEARNKLHKKLHMGVITVIKLAFYDLIFSEIENFCFTATTCCCAAAILVQGR